MDSTRSNAPQVVAPPPLLFGSALLLGIAFDRVLPIGATSGSVRAFLRLGGITFWIASGLLAGSAFLTLRRHRTTFRTDQPVAVLVTTGPFRFTRNPMYLSLALLLMGISAVLNSPWPVAWLVVALVLVQRFAIRPEERYLLQRYGTAYERYCRKVRRWL